VSTGNDRLEFPSLPLEHGQPENNRALVELNAIFLKACANDPKQRYASADEMLGDLALLQSGRSVKRQHALEANLVQARRVGLAAAVVALLAVGAVWFKSCEAERERRHRREIEVALHEANVARARAERNSGTAGARQASLDAIAAAVKWRGASAEARTDAITALAMTDFDEVASWPALATTVEAQALSEDFQWLAQTDARGAIHLSPIEGGRKSAPIRVLPGAGRVAHSVGPFSSDGSKLLVVEADNSTKVWDVARGELVLHLPPPRGVRPRIFTSDGQNVLVARRNGSVQLHDWASGHVTALDFGAPLTWFALNPDNRWLAGPTSVTNRVRVLAFPSGALAAELALPEGVAGEGAQFSRDSSRLAVTCSDYVIRVWDWRATSAPPVELRGHAAVPHRCIFHPDGQWLASTAYDGTTRLWDAVHGTLLRTIHNTSAEMSFSRDGHRLARLVTPGAELSLAELKSSEVYPSPGLDQLRALAASQWSRHRLFAGRTSVGIFGFGTLVNEGEFRKAGGMGESFLAPTVSLINNGYLEAQTGTLRIRGNFSKPTGTITLQGGTIRLDNPLTMAGGRISGNGAIRAPSVSSAATVAPAAFGSGMVLATNFTQQAAGTLKIDFLAASTFSRVIVPGTATLAGALEVGSQYGFLPTPGSNFQILACDAFVGGFATVHAPPGISVNYTPTGVFLAVTNAVSPRILDPMVSGGVATYSFGSAHGQSYTVERNDNLSTANWTFYTNLIGTGSFVEFTTPVTNVPQRFFRVRQP
jgi:hypothetical protein